ncbi:4Fe-4S dicluster domain-containing protein [Mesobacillus sp. AQ2]|nr:MULTISPECIES: 4Fe-4S dicluster domain-containing protein [unclassified Mesobacillus]MCM3124973.1 4Fe-4S dicluster domain-containing protein [Mesobacillus sp. MER 33]MCM3235267.1 4Fe-4S dicluster domain-containing protein [Mesobacillus sp. MER 48]WHX43021.1 4Fe-4S dicluster domain-containing protein [Mesobacillus sp. AQ2]
MGFCFNADDCIGCSACEIACKNENQTPSGINWRTVKKVSPELFLSVSCNHCDNPECFRVCPHRAFTKRRDGIVEINQNLCDGCQLCVAACPYHAPKFDPESHKVSKCQMCYPRQDTGHLPACVEACTTNALKLVNLGEFNNPNIVRSLPGFPDISITSPSIVFFGQKTRKRYFLSQGRLKT